MTASVTALVAAGLSFTFLPEEILKLAQPGLSGPFVLLMQIMGAMYFGFAMLNWMSRNSPIGGIYNKPIAIANFAHFFIGAMALLKAMISNQGLPNGTWGIVICYAIFAIAFGLMFFKSPVNKQSSTG